MLNKYLLNEWMNDEPVLLGSEQTSLGSVFSVTEFSSLHHFFFLGFCCFTLIIVMPHIILKVTDLKKVKRE